MKRLDIKQFSNVENPNMALYYKKVIMFDDEEKVAVTTNGWFMLISKPDYKKKESMSNCIYNYNKHKFSAHRGFLRKAEREMLDKIFLHSDGSCNYPNYKMVIPPLNDMREVRNVGAEELLQTAKDIEDYNKENPGLRGFLNFHGSWMPSNMVSLMAKMPKGKWYVHKTSGETPILFQNNDYTALFMPLNPSADNLCMVAEVLSA